VNYRYASSSLCSLLVLVGCENAVAPGSAPGRDIAETKQALLASPIVATADTTVRAAVPFGNDGTGSGLGVTSPSVTDLERALVRFDQAEIEAAIPAGQVLHKATVEMSVDFSAAGWLGGSVQILRMERDWEEGTGLGSWWAPGHGASWVCANDTNTTLWGNFADHCSPADQWGMHPTSPFPEPFASVPTDTRPVFTGGASSVEFDVTADIVAFLGGETNHGWLLRGGFSAMSGEIVRFASSESFNPPLIHIEYGDDECPSDSAKGLPGECGCGVPDIDVDGDSVADCAGTVLTADADTTVRLATPFANDGTGVLLGVTSASIAGLERALVRFDQSNLGAAVAGHILESAELRLSVAGVGLGWGGGQLGAYAIARDWPEGTGLVGHGPSWYCANDQNTTLLGNLFNDCAPGDEWAMGPLTPGPVPHAATPTATASVYTWGARTVAFDVTTDVEAFLAGSSNNGWLIRGDDDLLSGEHINFGSRESGVPPRLVLKFRDGIVDEDCDGADDQLELAAGLDPTDPSDGGGDPDGDGVPTADELLFNGDPFNSDTDGDGILDDVDLLAGVDLDGDAVAFESDNCPTVVNAAQLDADNDGTGDLCDDSPLGSDYAPLVAVQVQRNLSNSLYALRSSGARDAARLQRDQYGLIGTGTSFNLWSDGATGLVEVHELYHAATARHAYAKNATERDVWLGRGFELLDSLAYVSQADPGFGEAIEVRRFERGSGASTEQAVTADGSEADALVSDGYVQVSALGYGLRYQGSLTGTRTVVRFRHASAASLHTAMRLSEPGLAGADSEGPQFRVLAESNGYAMPLMRLRDGAGREALATGGSDIASLQAVGYDVEGVVGYVLAAHAQPPSNLPWVPLVRFTDPSGHYEHSADPDEIATLLAAGYVEDRVVARVVQLASADNDRLACIGRPEFEDNVNALPAGDGRDTAFLFSCLSSYTIDRVLNGHVESPTEELINEMVADMDAEAIRELEQSSRGCLDMDPAVRADLLGVHDYLDPVGSGGPVDYPTVAVTLQGLHGDSGSLNGGVTGQHVAFTKLRAPQCEGGTGVGATAVTATTFGFDNCTIDDELCGPPRVGRVTPTVYGVLPVTDVATAPSGDATGYADEHVDVGLPLIGVHIGPCFAPDGSDACFEQFGQRCYVDDGGTNRGCRQYPIVFSNTAPTFTGANFWDPITPQLRFQKVDDSGELKSAESFIEVHEVDNNNPDDRKERCEPDPVSTQPEIRSTVDEDLRCPVGSPPDVCVRAPDSAIGVWPSEDYADKVQPRSPIVFDQTEAFYFVEMRNHNGNYYALNDDVEPEGGRTVHVCLESEGCVPPPDAVDAACEVNQMPTCGGEIFPTGGLWSTPPRTLDDCLALDKFSNQCDETPLFFDSGHEDELTGLPKLVFVRKGPPVYNAQTRLVGVRCVDETGWDWTGKDELLVKFASLGDHYESLDDLQKGFGVIGRNGLDSGEKRHLSGTGSILGQTPVSLGRGQAPAIVIAVEDDAIGWAQILTVTAAAGLGCIAGELTGISCVGGAAAGALNAGLILASTDPEWADPDDHLGTSGWLFSLEDIAERGASMHDGDLNNTMATFPNMLNNQNRSVNARIASTHPAVDLKVHRFNGDVMSCVNDASCNGTDVCYVGGCVPDDFEDRSEAVEDDMSNAPFNINGTIERQKFRGEGADYRLYFSTSLRNGPPLQ